MLTLDRPMGRALRAFAEVVDRCVDHDAPPRRDFVEESIGLGNKLFEAIVDHDARWHESAFDAPESFDPAAASSIEELYSSWDRAAEKLASLAVLADVAAGERIRGLDSLLANRELAAAPPGEARDMSEGLISLRDEAASEHRAGGTMALDEMDD